MEYFGQTWSPSIGRPNPGTTKLKKNIYQSFWKLSFVHSGIVGLSNPLITSGASTFSKLGVQFLGLGYYCPSQEKKLTGIAS